MMDGDMQCWWSCTKMEEPSGRHPRCATLHVSAAILILLAPLFLHALSWDNRTPYISTSSTFIYTLCTARSTLENSTTNFASHSTSRCVSLRIPSILSVPPSLVAYLVSLLCDEIRLSSLICRDSLFSLWCS